jgi:hypothetical protein
MKHQKFVARLYQLHDTPPPPTTSDDESGNPKTPKTPMPTSPAVDDNNLTSFSFATDPSSGNQIAPNTDERSNNEETASGQIDVGVEIVIEGSVENSDNVANRPPSAEENVLKRKATEEANDGHANPSKKSRVTDESAVTDDCAPKPNKPKSGPRIRRSSFTAQVLSCQKFSAEKMESDGRRSIGTSVVFDKLEDEHVVKVKDVFNMSDADLLQTDCEDTPDLTVVQQLRETILLMKAEIDDQDEEIAKMRKIQEAALVALSGVQELQYENHTEEAAVRLEKRLKLAEMKEIALFPGNFLDPYAWSDDWEKDQGNFAIQPFKKYSKHPVGEEFEEQVSLFFFRFYLLNSIIEHRCIHSSSSSSSRLFDLKI